MPCLVKKKKSKKEVQNIVFSTCMTFSRSMYTFQSNLCFIMCRLNSGTLLVKFTNKIHGRVARHICPLPRGHHLSTVLIIEGIVGLSLSPSAESGHDREIHVGENTLVVQVIDANVDSVQARFGYVTCDGRVGALVFGHSQVPSPRLTIDLRVGVAFLLLHQQIDLTVCLFYASNSCRGGQCCKMSTCISINFTLTCHEFAGQQVK